ncbi:MAG TPA: indole-3-glycerol phosphate synthase TrpC [Blastocatellia bacterium]|nr:indole-3-glycerol phosphate synthase TrpC [Blastocatellia bacterium]
MNDPRRTALVVGYQVMRVEMNLTSTERIKPAGVIAAGGVLDRIVDAKLRRISEAKLSSRFSPDTRTERRSLQSFRQALSRTGKTNIVAEIKHRSPSRGVIRDDFDPVAIAGSYAAGGAAALSVLTEEDFFGGSLDHLRAVRDSISLPLLRKDFIFDEWQLAESADAGADAVLLIAAILDERLLAALISEATRLGLGALVEVHTKDEMLRAIGAGAQIIGVNNRDLTTFAVSLKTSFELAPLAPPGALLVSESGISTGEDIRQLKAAGFQAFLVGEHLMRADDPGDALRRLIHAADG